MTSVPAEAGAQSAAWRSQHRGTRLEAPHPDQVNVRSHFRKYHDVAEFIQDYADFICNNKRYAGAKGKTGRAYFQALKDAGYATDPSYVDKAMRIYKELEG